MDITDITVVSYNWGSGFIWEFNLLIYTASMNTCLYRQLTLEPARRTFKSNDPTVMETQAKTIE